MATTMDKSTAAPGIERLATIVEVEGHAPINFANAWITYAPSQMPGHDWSLVVNFYSNENRYHPVEIGDGYFEWLGDAMTQVTNCIRARGLEHCSLNINSVGQPPLADRGEA
jgi:hypothetical protein